MLSVSRVPFLRSTMSIVLPDTGQRGYTEHSTRSLTRCWTTISTSGLRICSRVVAGIPIHAADTLKKLAVGWRPLGDGRQKRFNRSHPVDNNRRRALSQNDERADESHDHHRQ